MPTPDLDALERLALTARELGFNANLHPTELDWLIAQARAVERVKNHITLKRAELDLEVFGKDIPVVLTGDDVLAILLPPRALDGAE